VPVASGSDNIYRSIEVRCYPNLELWKGLL